MATQEELEFGNAIANGLSAPIHALNMARGFFREGELEKGFGAVEAAYEYLHGLINGMEESDDEEGLDEFIDGVLNGLWLGSIFMGDSGEKR